MATRNMHSTTSSLSTTTSPTTDWTLEHTVAMQGMHCIGWGAVSLQIMMGWHLQHMTGTMTGAVMVIVHHLDGGTIAATVHT